MKKLDAEKIDEINKLAKEGKSIYYISRKLDLSPSTVHKYVRMLSKNNILQQKQYNVMSEDYKVKIALLERDIADLKKYIEQLTKPVEKKPLVIHKTGNIVEAYCPNCGVNSSLPLEEEKKLYTWADIEKFLTAPHEHGENILKCTNCGPKFTSWLQSQGYELVKKGEKNESKPKSRR